jgi:hypothetical protein
MGKNSFYLGTTIRLGLKYFIKSTTGIQKQQKVNQLGPGPTGSDRVRVQKILDPMGSSGNNTFLFNFNKVKSNLICQNKFI